MAHRQFTDSHGRVWDVWEVHPEYVDRRDDAPPSTVPKVDRRKRREFRAKLGALAAGWLCFETRNEKRRIAPIPDGWEQLSDADLAALGESGEPVRPTRRLIE